MNLIFWNVDTQYDFMRSNGKLYVHDAEIIEPNLSKLTEFAKHRGIKVVNTADWHNEETEEISENPDFKKTFPLHCMANTPGALYVPATNPENPYVIDWKQKTYGKEEVLRNRNVVVYKDKFDVFEGSPHSDGIVKLLDPKIAVVYGVAANVCVNDAVMGLLERNVKVYVPQDAIKELPGIPLPYDSWKNKGKENFFLSTTEEIINILGGKI